MLHVNDSLSRHRQLFGLCFRLSRSGHSCTPCLVVANRFLANPDAPAVMHKHQRRLASRAEMREMQLLLGSVVPERTYFSLPDEDAGASRNNDGLAQFLEPRSW